MFISLPTTSSSLFFPVINNYIMLHKERHTNKELIQNKEKRDERKQGNLFIKVMSASEIY